MPVTVEFRGASGTRVTSDRRAPVRRGVPDARATAVPDSRVQVRRLRSSESSATAVTTMTPLAMSCQCWLMLRL